TNSPALQFEVSRVEAVAHFEKNEFKEAERIPKESVQKFPEVDAAYDNLWRLYVSQADVVRSTNNHFGAAVLLTNALHVVDDQVRLHPGSASAWLNHGNLCIYVNDYDRAIQSFTTVLQLQKDHSGALLNRAIVNLR